MKYILGLGLSFNHYKGNTTIHIHSGDRFIDQIVLDQQIEKKYIYWDSKSDWLRQFESKCYKGRSLGLGYRKLKQPLPGKIYWYELDETAFGDKIVFHINDANTNYTNGFMTKCNMVMLEGLFLFPKVCEDLNSMDTVLKTASGISWIRRFSYQNGKKLCMTWLGGKATVEANVIKKDYLQLIDIHRKEGVIGDDVETHNYAEDNVDRFVLYCHNYNWINIYNEDQRSNHT